MKLKLIFLVLILNASVALSQSNKEIKFVVLSKSVSDSQTVYITGNLPAIGNWDPGAIPLTKERNDKWVGTFSLPEGFHLEYKITLGSWEKEALDDDENVPRNNTLEVLNDTTIIINVKSWKHQISREVAGQITGTVRYHKKLKWEGIRDRDVVVWLPPMMILKKDILFYICTMDKICSIPIHLHLVLIGKSMKPLIH